MRRIVQNIVTCFSGYSLINNRNLNVLDANKPDSFNGNQAVSVVNFLRDDQGQITGFKASNGRTLNVLFSKMAESE